MIIMPNYRCVLAVYKNDKVVFKGDYQEIAQYLDVSIQRVYQKLSGDGIFKRDGIEYTLIKTDEKMPKKKDCKPEQRKKYTISQINKMAKEAKMSYGQFVATMRR